jgi:hypothetical protein
VPSATAATKGLDFINLVSFQLLTSARPRGFARIGAPAHAAARKWREPDSVTGAHKNEAGPKVTCPHVVLCWPRLLRSPAVKAAR